jgi:hypothetical protein
VQVAPEVLQSYAGTYDLSPLISFTVTAEDSKLFARLTGQDKFQLFAESDTKFYYKIVDAQITFVKGEMGQVKELILHQGGRDLTAIRRR